MERTANKLNRDQWRTYHPDKKFIALQTENSHTLNESWTKAWALANSAAEILKHEFGAKKVVAFGSLLNKGHFSPWSDIDLAVWGIPGSMFYAAVGTVTGLSPHFKIDLIDPETCNPALLDAILNNGKQL